MANGMTFNGVPSTTYHLTSCVPRIPLLPTRRRSTSEIQGRDGTVDAENDSYEPRIIPVDCVLTQTSESDLRSHMAMIAVWLSGSGTLVFDHDTNKKWIGKVYNPIDPTQIPLSNIFTVEFECQPMALDVAETTGAAVNSATDYGSDVKFFPTINIALTANAAFVQVALTSTGELVRIEDTMINGDDIVINMATGKATINGTSCMDKVTITSIFFGVPTGSQTVTVTATSTFTATMNYYKRYLYA